MHVETLGEPTLPSPLRLSKSLGDGQADFTRNDAFVLVDDGSEAGDAIRMERAGPRPLTYFDGPQTHAGIVTCGGLCPGLNNVIRDLVTTLWHRYGVRKITGFRYGFNGLTEKPFEHPTHLDPDVVAKIHRRGGSVLGSSRGPQDPEEMIRCLESRHIDILFCVGGDGTMKGAYQLHRTAVAMGVKCAIVGLPKTIDNDLAFTERSFGFETAVSMASDAIHAARVEAEGAPRGIGLVKLMGRHSGFIAASATLASREVDAVLIPELAFDLPSLTQWVKQKVESHGQAVVVVAEGAGQEHLPNNTATDASGNARLNDIDIFLKEHFNRQLGRIGAQVKYIDPSYMIRAAAATPADGIFCGRLAENAVHAAMGGKTGLMIGLWGNRFVHIPLVEVTKTHKRVNPDKPLWRSVVESTDQPAIFRPVDA